MKTMTMEHGHTHQATPTLGQLIDALSPMLATRLDERTRGLAIMSVTPDSRAVRPGSLFVAVRGTAVDGHRFVRDAIASGAAAVVVEPGETHAGVPVVEVANSSKALALIASRFYGDPSRSLRLFGVTG